MDDAPINVETSTSKVQLTESVSFKQNATRGRLL